MAVHDAGEHPALDYRPPAELPGQEEEAVEVWMLEKNPSVIRRVMPEDPDSARQALIEGRVTVRELLDVEGKVQRIDRIEGPREFHRAATTAVRQWEFTPAVQSDRQGLDQPAFRLRDGIETRGRWIWVSAMRPCLSAAKAL
ncbi:MAG TPA: TonB family protein [Candidatus Latescibacteria bacterium]|nr:TonB family protein [Candidatus Latescibacterota bacterium]